MPIDPSTALGAAVVSALGELIFKRGDSAVGKTVSWLGANFEVPGERKEILAEIFRSNDNHILHAATKYQPRQGKNPPPIAPDGYPHDAEAMKAYCALSPNRPNEMEERYFETLLSKRGQLVITGGPNADPLTSNFLPCMTIKESIESTNECGIDKSIVPYWFVQNFDVPTVKVISKSHGNRPEQKTRKALAIQHSFGTQLWTPNGYMDSETLDKDFLLVSKLPRNNDGGTALTITGGHGPGTSAFRLLLNKLHITELRTLHAQVMKEPYWQFVLEVTKIHNSEKNGSSAVSAKLNTKERPPVVIKPKEALANS